MKKTAKITVLVIIIAFICSLLLLQLKNRDRICRGVRIANIEIGGKTTEEAKELLKEKWSQIGSHNLVFNYRPVNDNDIACCNQASTSITNFGFEIDYQQTIDQAFQLGHRPDFSISVKEQISAFLGNYNLAAVYNFNQEQFEKRAKDLFKDIESPPREATLIFDEEKDQFILQPSKEGTTINREQLLTDLSKIAKLLIIQPIDIRIDFETPTIEDNEVDAALEKAERFMNGGPFKLIFGEDVWTIKRPTLAGWIKFEPTIEGNTDNYVLNAFLDRDKVEKHLTTIAWATNQPVLDAKLEIEGNRATSFVLPQEGFGVQTDKTTNLLISNITAQPPIATTEIFVGKTSPQNTLAQTNNLGINTLIGQGKSNFSGSPKNRTHNIKTGAAKFYGLILAPEEEFSFNNLLGGSGAEQGFLPELVIKKGELIPEYGGGLCQVSTTFFRAAVNTGLEITERKPHAFPITYYNPQGFDATVYEPKPDLRFINNTPGHILIETLVQGNNLIFNFYGTDDGRQVKIIGPNVLEKGEDGSMKTVLTQQVYKDDQEIINKSFYSNYNSPSNYTQNKEE